MSLSAALSLESLSPEALMKITETEMGELACFYDDNGNGRLELEEFTILISEVINRMAATLPSEIPRKYAEQYHLPLSRLVGLEARIADKFRTLSRPNIAKQLFDLMDEKRTGTIEPEQLQNIHRLVETHLLNDLYASIGTFMVSVLMSSAS